MSPDIKNGGPAFPKGDKNTVSSSDGMSLRDWLAGQALAGFCARDYLPEPPAEVIASWSVQQADAVLDLLRKEKP